MPEEVKQNKYSAPFMKPSRFKELLEIFAKEFPEIFASKEIKLLKLGINVDIQEKLDLPMPEIKGFLRMYCKSPKYLEAQIQGAKRYNLAGEVVGEITDSQAMFAQNTLKRKAEKKQSHDKDIKRAS